MKFRQIPNQKQFDAIQLLYDFETKYLLFGGGAGGGKSWLGCEWELAMCLNYPGVRYFIGRDELKSLKDTTVKTFFKVAKQHNVMDTFRYYEHYSAIRFHNGSEISLLGLDYLPGDPLFERFGSTEYTGGFIEEAGEVHFNAFDTLKTRVGRQLNEQYNIPRKVLITCNPKKNWLYQTFYKPQKEGTLEKGYAFIQALAKENDKIDKGYLEALDEIKDKVLKQRLKYGEWEYEDDPANLVNFESVMSIFTNSFVSHGPFKCITADIARFGADTTTIRVWHGFRVVDLKVFRKLSVPESAAKIKEIATKQSIPMHNTVVDEDGVGGGVVDILKCKGFVNNSSPLFGQNYDNLKSQCGYRIAEIINQNLIFESCEDTVTREEVAEELQLLKQKNVDSDKKLGLIPKEKMKDLIGRSPNHLDTYIMRGIFALQPVSRQSYPTAIR
jgi:phage terminase large subunit